MLTVAGSDSTSSWRSPATTRRAAPRRLLDQRRERGRAPTACEPAAAAGSRVTQTLEGKASGFTAKMLIPIVQPRLESKLKDDLERLKTLLEG